MELAKILRRSENEFVGVASGLLDQFSALFGRADHAFVLDCLTSITSSCRWETPRRRSSSATRRPRGGWPTGCTTAGGPSASGLSTTSGSQAGRVGPTLRDVTLDELRGAWDDLDPVGRLRARHVLTENDRVAGGPRPSGRAISPRFGALMSASHASSRDDFENSSPRSTP